MCWSALPDHINSPSEWDGKDDDDHFYTKWRKSVKGWFAYGPRDTHWYHRMRLTPMVIFALFGKGESRWENEILAIRALNKPVFWHAPHKGGLYLSRVQYWCDWHVSLSWPLFFSCHFGNWQFYVGLKRDADIVYWVALFFGRKWK